MFRVCHKPQLVPKLRVHVRQCRREDRIGGLPCYLPLCPVCNTLALISCMGSIEALAIAVLFILSHGTGLHTSRSVKARPPHTSLGAPRYEEPWLLQV